VLKKGTDRWRDRSFFYLPLTGLATKPEDQHVRVREIAEDLKIPVPFLSKIVQTLSRQNLIQSHKGPGGGVMLATSSSKITLLQIVEVIDGFEVFEVCALGIPSCSGDFPCPLHETWGSIRSIPPLISHLIRQILRFCHWSLTGCSYMIDFVFIYG